MSEARAIARNAVTSYGARILLVLSVLLLTPYLFRRLGTDGFGTWSVIYTIGSIFALIEFGFSAGVTKLVAELRGKGDQRGVQALVGASVTLMSGMGVVALVLSLLAAAFLDGLAAQGERDAFRTGMSLLGVAMLVRLPLAAYGASLIGYQQAHWFNAGEAVAAVGFPIGAVVAIESGAGIAGVAAAYGGALVGAGILFAVFLRRTDPRLSMRPRFADRATRRKVRSFASLTLLADAMVFVGTRMDTIVIAALRGAAAAAPFAAAVKLQSGLQSLTFPIYLLFMPMVSEMWASGRRAEVVTRMELATRIAIQITLPVGLALALFSTDIVDLWLGEDAPSVTAAIIVLLVSSQVVTLSVVPAEKTLIGLGRVRLIGAIAVVEGISNLALSIFLVSRYGAVGAALGTLLTYGMLAPIKVPLAARTVGVPTRQVLASGVVPALLSSIVPGAWMLAAWSLLPSGPLRLAVGMGVGLLIWLAVGLRQVGVRRVAGFLRTKDVPQEARTEPPEAELLEL
ncbi:MAG TPA: oligosaccharide flippase family protein [Solirubrobacterales bacterium]|nr:oligosaccharide flippase family protein [Solirubrobacterales bacterium]